MTISDELLEKALANPEAILTELSRIDCEEEFAQFVEEAWHVLEPTTELSWNWHIETVCGYLEALHERKIKRLIINIPPGSLKSLLVSVFYPAWVWTKDPGHRFLSVANGDTLAVRDSQKHKWLVESDWYQARWPMEIAKDQAGKGLFGNKEKGIRQAIGITANITGLRGDTQLWDDLLDATKADSEAERLAVINAIDQKLSSRLNNPEEGVICLIMQRLQEDDPTGHLLRLKKEKWVHLVIPMEYEGYPTFDAGKDIGRPDLNDPRTKKGELLDKNRYTKKTVEGMKEQLGSYGSSGQLQQRPVPKGGGIIKKDMWQKWPEGKPLPLCIHVFSSYDTAFEERDIKSNAYSARTDWGIFEDESTGKYAMILLGAWHGQVGFPQLRNEARTHHRHLRADRALIEKKASGHSLLQELRKAKISVYAFNPKRLDKIARAHLASPMWDAGLVYYPDKQWAKNVIDWVSKFPNGSPPSADYMDTVSQAGLYVRRRNFMELPGEEELEEPEFDETDEFVEDSPTRKMGAYG